MSARVGIVAASVVTSSGDSWRGLAGALATAPAPGATAQLARAYPDAIGREVSIPAGQDPVAARVRKLMSRGAHLAAIAARRLAADAGGPWQPDDRVGFFLGVGASGGSLPDLEAILAGSVEEGTLRLDRMGGAGLAACNPLLAFQLMNNFTLCHAAIQEGTTGPTGAFFSRGAGTVLALREAARAVASGACSRALAGGADSALHPVTYGELARAGRIAAGLVPGEGAALLALAAEPAAPLAWLEGAAVASGNGRSLEAAALEAVAAAAGDGALEGVEGVVIAAWGPPAREALAGVAARWVAPVHDLSVALGDSLAALPALAWAAGLDLVVSGGARRVVVLSAGIDGDVGAVVLAGPAGGGGVPVSSSASTLASGVQMSSSASVLASGVQMSSSASALASGVPVSSSPSALASAVPVSSSPSALASTPAPPSPPTPRARASSAQPRRAVISGAGVVSAFGVGLDPFLDALAAGRSAVGPIRSFDAATFPTRVAGEVPIARPAPGWVAAQLAGLPAGAGLVEALALAGGLRDRKVVWALLAAAEAWRRAGCGEGERGAVLCLALGLEQAFLEDFGPMVVGGALDWSREPVSGPRHRYRTPVDLAAHALRELLGLRGSAAVHASACAAGAMAVAHAAELVCSGEADVAVCGGADSMVNPLGIGGMSRLGAPSPRNAPDACRPFDRRRDGLVIGEGAALFVVELEERARARGVRPLARVEGWATTQDAFRATAPRPDGSLARRAMEGALARAGLPASAIGYVNAHGTGTPLNDPAEARAIRELLGAEVPVSSIKGAIGHLMAASGAIEIAACLLPLGRGVLPGTAHHEELDPDCPIAVIGPRPIPGAPEHLLSNSFGFGGQNACVVLGAPR